MKVRELTVNFSDGTTWEKDVAIHYQFELKVVEGVLVYIDQTKDYAIGWPLGTIKSFTNEVKDAT